MRRREVLGLLGSFLAMPASAQRSQEPWPTPSPPSDSPQPILAESYGSLKLGNKRHFWPWKLEVDECCVVDLELQLEDRFGASLDILTFEEDDFRRYQDRVTKMSLASGPVVDIGTGNFFGIRYPKLEIHRENVNHPDLKELTEGPTSTAAGVLPFRLESASFLDVPSGDWSFRLGPGSYRVVFDWTNAKTRMGSGSGVNVDVALRARPTTEAVEGNAETAVTSFFGSIQKDVVQACEKLAKSICNLDTRALSQIQVGEIGAAPISTLYAIPVLTRLLTAVQQGFNTPLPLASKALDGARTWANWATTTIPVVSSAQQVVNDACELADKRSNTAEKAEDFLLSIGLLIANLALAWFGVSSKVAKEAIQFTDEILLGVFKRTLSTRSYLLLLRELYTLFYDGATEVVDAVQEMTTVIANQGNFFDAQETKQIHELDESSLFSLDSGFLDDDTDCPG